MGERNTSMSGSLIKGDSKALGVIHPKSRKAEQLGRAMHRETKKAHRGRLKDRARHDQANFMRFFQRKVLEEAEKRKTRELEVKLLIDAEKQKLRTGYLAPDLRMNKTVSLMRAWDGSDVGAPSLRSLPSRPS